ncbi:MAG: very short patch repair endonuclease, partial [Clostridiales Family XIII bacterium]|nr:very short patch repair endonuclease [Clostridiales Family XIII bacterium]
MGKRTKEQISYNMQRIRSKDSRIELLLRKELWRRGLRYRKNVSGIEGKPDIVFLGKKVAVFCDSEFWHGYNWEERKSDFKSNRDFWIPKIERNMLR